MRGLEEEHERLLVHAEVSMVGLGQEFTGSRRSEEGRGQVRSGGVGSVDQKSVSQPPTSSGGGASLVRSYLSKLLTSTSEVICKQNKHPSKQNQSLFSIHFSQAKSLKIGGPCDAKLCSSATVMMAQCSRGNFMTE